MRRVISAAAVLALLAGLFSPFPAHSAHACSCAESTAQEYVDRADFIVIGSLLAKDLTEGTVRVERYLKGLGPFQITVSDHPQCNGLDFVGAGDRYLLFVVQDDTTLRTSYCDGTRRLDGSEMADSFLREVAQISGLGESADYTKSACGSETDLDLIRGSPIIIGGRFTGWDYAPRPFTFIGPEPFRDIQAHLETDKVYKDQSEGRVDLSHVDLADQSGFAPNPDVVPFYGAFPFFYCGAFPVDPSGLYGILGIWGGPSSGFQPVRAFFLGPDPSGPDYDKAVAELATLGEPHPPPSAKGNSDDFPYLPAAAIALLIPTLFLAASAAWPRR